MAWSFSGDTNWGSEIDDWDLWQIHFLPTDDCRLRVESARIIEIKVHSVISPSQIWWVGTRQPWLTFGESSDKS
jgi:hypothetical protein